MKITVTIARILTGLLFIFSGLVKAIDPRGLAYKMQEFFEAWANDGFMKGLMDDLNHYALVFSIIMITLEVVVGVALLIGWKKKFTTWILLLLMLFFTFLTSYVLFSGKIRACGCFGDCIPLTPVQTFTKDIVLLILSLLLLVKRKYITPIAKPFFSLIYITVATLLTLLLQFYVLRHLPLVDCLPYKKGNDILKLRQMPPDAVQDKKEFVFVYEKNGVKKDFPVSALPDSSWTFSDRKEILIEKGRNNVPLINDFSLTTESGNDTTDAILGHQGEYYLLFIKDMTDFPSNWDDDIKTAILLTDKKIPVFIITAQRNKIKERLAHYYKPGESNSMPPIFTADATAIKTAARANPTLYRMNGPVVQGKWGWPDFADAVK